jgi:hypothetical protein
VGIIQCSTARGGITHGFASSLLRLGEMWLSLSLFSQQSFMPWHAPACKKDRRDVSTEGRTFVSSPW